MRSVALLGVFVPCLDLEKAIFLLVRHEVAQEMRGGPSEPACRSGFKPGAKYGGRLIGLAVLHAESPGCLFIGRLDGDPRSVDKSRMNREVHVRFLEDVEVRFPRVTRL